MCPPQQSVSLSLQGFGVCEFTSRQDAQEAIEKLDQSELQGTFNAHFYMLLSKMSITYCLYRADDRSSS